MGWDQQDNKHYRGPIDRAFVSMTEPYEVAYFVDEYLRTRGYQITEQSRAAIRSWLPSYPGHAPIRRDALTLWLDVQIAAASKRSA
jgi:hypothetical protein